MNICLLVFTDGRGEYLEPTLESFAQNVTGNIVHSILIDDSANDRYAEWLDARYGDWFTQVIHHETRRGFAGAVQSGWDNLPDCDFVFHLEDDFTFNAKVNLDELAQVLTAFPYLAQIVLKRQPVNEAEKQAGGIVELNPNEYKEQTWNGFHWTEHQRNFSTNPTLYPRLIAEMGFPQETGNNERLFSDKLSAIGFRYAYWGRKFDAPLAEHIGAVRIGIGY